jgi:succinyl-CoA synthetase alpha subunit
MIVLLTGYVSSTVGPIPHDLYNNNNISLMTIYINKIKITMMNSQVRRLFSSTANVWVNKNTHVICQGITGKEGTFQTEQALKYNTKMVGGVSPRKAG